MIYRQYLVFYRPEVEQSAVYWSLEAQIVGSAVIHELLFFSGDKANFLENDCIL